MSFPPPSYDLYKGLMTLVIIQLDTYKLGRSGVAKIIVILKLVKEKEK